MIGLISDTHDNVSNILKAVEIFKKNNPEIVFHLGDVVAPATIRFFQGINMKFIKGNCDGDIQGMESIIQSIGGEYLGESANLEMQGKNIALIHGNDETKLNSLIESQKYDYVFHGHTHRKAMVKIGRTTIINPGAHYYGAENSIAMLNLKTGDIKFMSVIQ